MATETSFQGGLGGIFCFITLILLDLSEFTRAPEALREGAVMGCRAVRQGHRMPVAAGYSQAVFILKKNILSSFVADSEKYLYCCAPNANGYLEFVQATEMS